MGRLTDPPTLTAARAEPSAPAAAPPARIASIDAYRGLVMFLMMAEVLRTCAVAKATGSRFWEFLCGQQTHVEWVGCTLHDLIQPSFSFLVGVALPFSIASRAARGQSAPLMLGHAAWRALVLVSLGVFLRSVGRSQTNFTFEDTLSQIGLGYVLLFSIGLRPPRDQWITLGAILAGYWMLFAFGPLPGPDFDTESVGVPRNWPFLLDGFAAHWQKNMNSAAAFDVWFLNLFPREKPFAYNGGGYLTLSFIPTLGTMLLGLIAGRVLRNDWKVSRRAGWFAAAAVIGLAGGSFLGATGLCPVVKRIWTPSWVLYSGGWCFLFLAGFHLLLEGRDARWWAFPLIVIGANSIAAYCMAHLFDGFIAQALLTNLGRGVFQAFGEAYEPFLHGAAVLLVLWLILLWMYRRRIFLRI